MGGIMNTKVLIGLAAVLGLLLIAFLAPHEAPEPPDPGDLVAGGHFVIESSGVVLLEEQYTVFFHPTEGYMLLSQGTLQTADQRISLAQQAQFDRGFLPVFYQLAAKTATGTQIISAQLGLAGLTMEVRVGTSRRQTQIPDASNLALLDNNLIGHYAVLLMALRAGAIGGEFTAAVPQALLSLPATAAGPSAIEFHSGETVHQGERFDVRLGDTEITLIEYEGRLVGLVNRSQGTLGYDVDRFPDGIEVPEDPMPTELPGGVSEEETTFPSSELTLVGTITLPAGDGPFPAVLFIHGSGPLDRDGNAPGFRMDAYRQLAHGLAEAGIASLRFDKRGVSESEGDAATASRSDLLDDVRAALAALREHDEVDSSRVVLVGHSEGAYLAPVIAAEDPTLKGIAVLAGAARPLDEITRWQVETTLRQQGASEEQVVAAALDQEDEYIAFVEGSNGEWSDYSVEDLQTTLPWLTEEAAGNLLATPLALSWLREHYLDDPAATLASVTIPVFVLNGEKDMQVPAEEAERIDAVLRDAGNSEVTVYVLPDLNHLLRYHSEEPSLVFRHIADPVDPRVIDLLRDWTLARVGG